jgi:predicted metal-dependent HD superfamily phosphohydrolase
MEAFQISRNEKTFAQLRRAYAQKHRHYHTGKHVGACLHQLDHAQQLTDKKGEIEIALWFHDAIYKPYSAHNELNSALWAQDFLQTNGVDENSSNRIYQLIMVTLHNGEPQSLDQSYMLDIDLAILGSATHIYQTFEHNVRKEYRWIPHFYYRKKRIQILQGFLAHEHIYQTDYFRELFEDKAQENLQQAILSL